MSCQNQGIVARIFDRSAPSIIQGSQAYLETQLVYKGDNSPAALSNFIGATGFFAQANASDALAVSGTLISEDLATVRFDLSENQTALLKSGDENSFEISVEDDEGLRFFQFLQKLSVSSRLF